MPTKEQRNLIFNKLGYAPSAEQREMHEHPARIKLVAGGERSGKSRSSSMELVSRFFEGKLFWLVAADYGRTKAEFDYICDALDKLEIAFNATKQVDPGEIEVLGGFRIATKSTKDPRKIAMEAPDGIVVCEASQIDYETFLRLRGRIAEKRGWLLMSGTFENSLGWYPELFSRWAVYNPSEDAKSFSLPTWTNLAVFPGGRHDPEIIKLEQSSSIEWFQERYGGVPCPPKGRVFDEFSPLLHVTADDSCEFNPAEEVYLFVDPGYASAYAVLAAHKRGEELFVFDEIFERGIVTSEIIKIAKQRPWWNQVISGYIDIAAKQHQAMASPIEIWQNEAGVYLHAKKVSIRDGIEAVKRFLLLSPLTGTSLLHVNSRCLGLISEFGAAPNPITNQTAVYQWKVNREGNVVGDVPGDRNNHAIKALTYGLVGLFGFTKYDRAPAIQYF